MKDPALTVTMPGTSATSRAFAIVREAWNVREAWIKTITIMVVNSLGPDNDPVFNFCIPGSCLNNNYSQIGDEYFTCHIT
jgi:hypothetical protein